MRGASEVKVWDLFVRFFHWGLVIAFAIAYISEGEPRWLHVYAGYFIGGLIVLRILWGFVGTRYARFQSFLWGPREVLGHLRDVARFRAKPYLGHDPAGGAMIVALLLAMALTGLSGMLLYGVEDKKGPFAGWRLASFQETPLFTQAALAHRGEEEHRGYSRRGYKAREEESEAEEWVEEVHEVFANLTLFLSVLHIGGVLLVSLETRENLVWSMITGRKRVRLERLS